MLSETDFFLCCGILHDAVYVDRVIRDPGGAPEIPLVSFCGIVQRIRKRHRPHSNGIRLRERVAFPWRNGKVADSTVAEQRRCKLHRALRCGFRVQSHVQTVFTRRNRRSCGCCCCGCGGGSDCRSRRRCGSRLAFLRRCTHLREEREGAVDDL